MKAKRGLVITVAGPHGSGRSTQATKLAEVFSLRYVSTGTLFRERAQQLGVSLEEMTRIATGDDAFDRFLDDRAKEETRKGGVVLDATLSGWVAVKPDLRIYLTAPLDVRVKRIAGRENRDVREVEKETTLRERNELERFRRYYDFDLSDLSIYDVILNTEHFDADIVANILKNVVEAYMVAR
ncbi:TPA: AAA family ATPase [Candidatus Bathyarchaeota archaeon]|nr:AAA family ATPase [Candidatus Bathyarchaeota archaeon]